MVTDFTRLFLALGAAKKKQAALPRGHTGSVVGTTNDGRVVAWPEPSANAASHVLLLGGSGAGKSVLAASALLSEFVTHPRARRETIFVIDPKGDLVELLFAGLAAVAPARLADVFYMNPFSTGGFAFNVNHLALGSTPVDIRAMQIASLVAETSTAAAQAHGGMGSRQLDVLQNVILGALETRESRASILLALDALTVEGGLASLSTLTRSDRARLFLASARLSEELRASTAARLRTAFAASEALERLVSAPACVQFSDLTAPGKLVILDLGNPTGGLQSLQKFWANMFLRLAIEHLMERPSPWSGHHVRIVIDEAQIVAPVLADIAERLLTTGRSRGLSLTFLTQGTTLIEEASSTLLRVLLSNTSTRFIGRLAARDAELLAREQAPSLGVEEAISAVRSRFVAAVCNLKDREFFALLPGLRERFMSSTIDLAAWRAAALREEHRIQAAKVRLALPRTSEPRLRINASVSREKPKRKAKTSRRAPKSPWG
jgi:hypothetical protein